jgi:hypothetical protein
MPITRSLLVRIPLGVTPSRSIPRIMSRTLSRIIGAPALLLLLALQVTVPGHAQAQGSGGGSGSDFSGPGGAGGGTGGSLGIGVPGGNAGSGAGSTTGTGTGTATGGGAPITGGGGVSTVGSGFARNTGGITLTVGGASVTVPASVVQAVGQTLSAPTPQATTAFVDLLTAGGVPGAPSSALGQALSALGSTPTFATLVNAVQAYNAAVQALPAGASPPPALLAARAALVQLLP